MDSPILSLLTQRKQNNMGLGLGIILAGAYVAWMTNDGTRLTTRIQGQLLAAVFIGAGVALVEQAALT